MNLMKKLKRGFLLLVTFSLLAGCAAGGDNADEGNEGGAEGGGEDKGTVTMGVTPWSSTVPPTTIARLLLEDMGYEVEEINADAGGVYTGLARGDIDVFMDSWLPDMHRNYMDKYGDDLDDTAVSYPNGELGWVVPENVEGIDSVDDIKGNEDKFGGKIYGIEEGAGMTMTSKEMIEEYGLDLEYVASSEGGMLAQASREMKGGNPVLFLGWRPHPMFVDYDLKVLKDPKEFFKTSEVHVITNKGFKDEAPEAYEFFQKWSIDVGEIEEMIVEMDNGREAEEVAQEWIDNHPDEVAEMTGGNE